MAGDQHKLTLGGFRGSRGFKGFKSLYIVTCCKQHLVLLCCKGGIALELIDNHVEGINNGIAGDEDLTESVLCLEVRL